MRRYLSGVRRVVNLKSVLISALAVLSTWISIKLGAPMTYELDGGARDLTTKVKARVVPGAITICVPPH